MPICDPQAPAHSQYLVVASRVYVQHLVSVSNLSHAVLQLMPQTPVSQFVLNSSHAASVLQIHSSILHAVCSGTPDWEKLVPNHVRDQIKTYSLLGYRSRPAPVLTNGSGGPQHEQQSQDRPQLVPK